jgi:hypothetical protein
MTNVCSWHLHCPRGRDVGEEVGHLRQAAASRHDSCVPHLFRPDGGEESRPLSEKLCSCGDDVFEGEPRLASGAAEASTVFRIGVIDPNSVRWNGKRSCWCRIAMARRASSAAWPLHRARPSGMYSLNRLVH